MGSTNLPAVTGATQITRRRGANLGRPLGEQVAATLQASARSEHTLRGYTTAIGLFLGYFGQAIGAGELATPSKEGRRTVWAYAGTCAPLRHIEPGHLDGYKAWRSAQGDGPDTVANRAAAVTTFLEVAYRDGMITDRQALSMGIRPYKARQRRDVQPTGRRLSKDEVRALRDVPDLSTNKGRRDLAILDLGLYAGLRCEELGTLDMGNIRQDGGRWWLVFAGKGQHTRRVKVHDALYASLQAWLAITGRGFGKGEGPVFCAVNKGDAITTAGLGTAAINRLVAEYGYRAGLAPLNGGNRLSPHDLRRTCARNAYDNGAPLPMIQRMLGHQDVSTTMRYVGADDDHNGGAIDFLRY